MICIGAGLNSYLLHPSQPKLDISRSWCQSSFPMPLAQNGAFYSYEYYRKLEATGQCRRMATKSGQNALDTDKLTSSIARKLGVSAATDRPARREGSAHAKYSVSHHMVFKPFLLFGLAAEYRSRQWVWSTVVRWPTEVYDSHQWTKLTTPETFSRSRDMAGAHQNLNDLRDLITPHFRDSLSSMG